MKQGAAVEHKWARLFRRVRSDEMSEPNALAEFDRERNIVFINALAFDYAPEHEQAAVFRPSTFDNLGG